MDFLRHHQFLEQKGRRERDLHLEITEHGSEWLRTGGKDRLKTVLDGLRGKRPGQASLLEYQVSSFVPHALRMPHERQVVEVASALRSVFKESPVEVFVRLRDFLAY